LLQVRDAELQALQQRLAELEGSLLAEGGIDDSAMVEELPIDELADDGEVVADMDATGLVDEADVEVEEVVEEVPAETTVVTSSKSGGSVIDTVLGVLGNIWLWIGLAVVVVVGLVFFRSKKAAPAIGSLFDEDDMAPAAREDRGAPIAQALPEGFEPSSFNPSMVVEESLAEEFLNGPVDSSESALDGDAETASSNSSSGLAQSGDLNDDKTPFENTVGSETTINLDNSDPIAQADFHLAYGLYDQAADILVKALEDEPENKIARVKLLEVYFVWENEQGFIGEARKLHQQVGGEANSDWNKVVIMGKQICPEDPLFEGQSEGVGGSQILDIALDSTPASDQLDMNLGEAADEGLDLDFGNDGDFQYEGETFDFDVGANDAPTMETPTIEAPGSESPTMEMPGSESPTMETPTIEMPTASSDSASISLDDLGIDLGDLDELLGDDDLAATQNNLREDPAADESDVVDPTLTMLAGKIDISVTSLEDSDDAYDASANTETLAIDSVEDGDDSDIGTKLDLARAYIEMSDPEGARSILSEVLEEGDSSEQDEARRLLEQLD
jgi:pilus assembly protein FimV